MLLNKSLNKQLNIINIIENYNLLLNRSFFEIQITPILKTSNNIKE